MLPLPALLVKERSFEFLVQQAEAAEQRAVATAAWHRERAARYLAWVDSSWAAARFAFHAGEAVYQDRLAVRYRAIGEALEGGSHDHGS